MVVTATVCYHMLRLAAVCAPLLHSGPYPTSTLTLVNPVNHLIAGSTSQDGESCFLLMAASSLNFLC